VFTGDPHVLHAGEANRILLPVVGPHSLLLLDEDAHMEHRKLLLPPFHGQRMKRYGELMSDIAAREIETWPLGEPYKLRPRMQAVTLEIILRAVFGLDAGKRLDAMRERLTGILQFGGRPASTLPMLQRGREWRKFLKGRDEADAMIYETIDERRKEKQAGAGGTAPGLANGGGREERDDILAMLLEARHEDGSPMSPVELRDELMTLLVAGHETTASELAWAFERLTRTPDVLARLTEEIDSNGDDSYVTATVHETLRRRPVLPNAAPRLVMEPVEVGGWRYEPGVCLIADAYLLHHDPDIYPDPYAFRPERFLDEQPGTYTWIPFGGGRRRCLGASFAMLEMKIVLRAVLGESELAPAAGDEGTRRRSITLSPGAGSRAVLRARRPARAVAERPAGAEPPGQPAAA
jgi:cytochrome P450